MKKSDVDRILGLNESKEEKKSEAQKRFDELGWLGKALMTYQDIGLSTATGLYNAVEGVYDAGAGIVGAGVGLFSKKAKENIGNHIAYDVVGNTLGKTVGAEMIRENSYLNGNGVGSFVRDTLDAAGGMLPSVALSFIPGAGPAISMATTGASAGGNAMESALNDGAGYYQSLAYGVGVGAVEAATEKLGGFVLGDGTSLVGKALAGTKVGKFTSKGLGKVAETFISEGVEEVSADLADPALKYATGVDKNIGENYKTVGKNLPETFLLGGTVGSIFGGANVGVNAMRNSGRGGIRASRADESFSYISEVSKNYGKDEGKNAKYDKAIDDALTDISRELSSMDDTARKNYMDGMGAFKNAFNDDGSIKMDLRADLNDGAVSSNLRAISAVLKYAPVSADTQISEGASKAKSTVESLLQERASVVISDKIGKNNALYNIDEGIIYINNNAKFTGEQIAQFVAMHEVAHITEGTIDYVKFAEELDKIASDENAPASVKEKIGDVKARAQSIRDNYQGQMEDMSLRQREYLVDTELRADLAGVLLGDDYFIEKLAERNLPLTKKIFNGLKSLVTRGRDVEGAVPYNQKNPSVDRESARYLNKLVNKFGKAIDKAQGGVRISQIGREDEEQSAEVDEVRYLKSNEKSSIREQLRDNLETLNKMQPVSVVDSKPMTRKEMLEFATDEFRKIGYQIERQDFGRVEIGKKEINDSINYLYQPGEILALLTVPKVLKRGMIIDGHDNHKNRNYETITIAAPVLINGTRGNVGVVVKKGGKNKYKTHRILMPDGSEFVFEIKKDIEPTSAGVKGENHRQGPAISSMSNNSISENGEKINTFDKKIDDERKSISKSVDSEGNSLSAGQAEYFKDSKVRDENGNLLVVYHGSDAVFNEFKHRYINTHGSQEGRGFYFTDSVNMARGYKKGEGQLLKGYVNISKPLSDTALTLTRKEVASLIKAIDPTGDDLIANYDTGGGMGYPSRAWYNRAFNDTLDAVMNYCDTDSEVLAELRNAGADEEKLLKTVRRTLGYDGYITSEKYENAQIFVAFESNQFKNADNTAPTDNPDIRYSKPKSEKFMPGRCILMTTAEELVEGYDADMISAEEALKKLNVLGLQTDITIDNALDTLREFIPEIREFAASEREAYRESNKKEVSPSVAKATAPSSEGAITEEDANEQARKSLDYWVRNGDYTQGTVRYVQNGKVKVKLAQTANEVQLAKFINNNIMSKSYTNKDVKNIIDKILSNIDIWGGDWDSSYMAKLKSEDMTSVKKQLWAALNTAPEGERMGPALDIADYIVKHGVLTEVVSVTDDVYYAQTILDVLNTYKRKIDVSHIKGDIEAKYDTDRSPFTTWALKKNATERGYTADEVALELEEYGVVLNGDRGKLINEADIFIAIHELYNKSRKVIKDAAPSRNDIIGTFDADKVHEVKQKIANEILNSYDEYGKETAFSKVEKKYRKEIEGLKRRVKDVHEENRLKNAVLYEAQKFIDSKKGKYHNSTQVQDEALKGLKSLLGRIKYRSDLNRSSTRAIINELAKWYTEDNPVLQGFMVDKKTSESRGLYSPHIKALIDLFLIEDVEFSKDKIVSNFGSFSEKEIANYNNSDKISVAENDEQIKTFIDDALSGKINGKKLIVGKLSEDLVDKIKKSTEVDLQGFNFELRADALMHMKKHHGNAEKEANRGQVPVDTNAVINAIEVVTSFDTVEKGKNDNSLVFTKNINSVYHVVTYYAYGNKSIYPHTLYITKKDGLAQTNNANENNSYLARNVQDDLSTATNNSITENDEIVKVAEEKRAQKAQKPLDTTELEALNQILHHMNFVFETYGKIWRGGRWVDAPEIAKGQIEVLQEARENETVVGKLLKQDYFNFFMDPEFVCARLDGGNKNGYLTTSLEDLRQADIKQRYDEMLALQRYDEFEKKHKKYIKELMSEKNTVRVGNKIDLHAEGGPTADILEIPRYAALDLYMVSKTRGALETFAETGWRLRLDSGNGKLDTPQATITEAQIKGIEKQLTKEDIELIEIMEEQYNVNLRRLKYDTDMIRLGMSNVFDGYYYPINRISANNLDSNDFFFDLERVSNSSFNNSRVKGAKQAIIVSNVLTKFKKHVNGVTRYANLSIPIENMTKLLNINIGTNDNMPQSITMLLRETKDGLEAEKYVKTLIKDVQQVNIQTDASTKAVSYLRGAYAKSTLGLNPKVLFTQASSYIAGFGELRFSSLVYGLANIGKLKGLDSELDKYCPWAAVRHYEKGTTRAMTVTDKVNKFGDFFTKGIEFMDRQIVKLEFLACQKEAQARFGLKIGTEENKIKAGELLQELGLKTQQNQLTTEKSAAMRSQSEFAKTLTMFKADSMKQVSRFLQTINAMSILKKKMDAAKRSGDNTKYSALEVEYKKAQKSFCKYSAVIIASSVYMVLLARLFNKLYRKEEEDENKVLGYFEDIFGNICGMVPIISELYAFFIDGFEVNSFMYSTINNVMDAVKGTTELVGATINGEDISSEKAMTEIRKLAYSIGALAGIPTKNVYKNTKALVDIISPTTGDRVDAWFKEPSEKSLEEKIEAGIEKGDDKAVSTSLDLLYGKYDLELEDAVLRREYDRLIRLEMTKNNEDEKNGVRYAPLEAKIPDSIKIDGEEVELMQKDVNAFKNAFSEAEKVQASMVKTLSYKKLNDEQKAFALRKISQFYYEDEKYNYTGEKSNFSYYAKVVGVQDMALVIAYAKGLKGDEETDSRGRLSLRGMTTKQSLTRREKIEAYIKSLRLNSVKASLVLRYLGYSDKENDEAVASYISRASVLSKSEREEFSEIISKTLSKKDEEEKKSTSKNTAGKIPTFVR